MKYATIILLLMFLGTALSAHAAGEVNVSYDANTKLVTVSFTHSVKSATEHYIGKVTLRLNGKAVVSQALSLQESATGGTLIYKVPGLKKGDILEAATECNKGGTKSGKLTLK